MGKGLPLIIVLFMVLLGGMVIAPIDNAILSIGLRVHYDFNSVNQVEDAMAPNIIIRSTPDLSPEGNTGTYKSEVDSQDGVLHLPGKANAYVRKQNPRNFPINQFTIAFKMRSGLNNGNVGIVSYAVGGGPSADEVTIAYYQPDRVILVWIDEDNGGNSLVRFPAGLLFDGQWHHVAVTWSNVDGLVKMYTDGVEVTAERNLVIAQGRSIAADGTLVLGQRATVEWPRMGSNGNQGGFSDQTAFKGDLDDFRVYNVRKPLGVIRALKDISLPPAPIVIPSADGELPAYCNQEGSNIVVGSTAGASVCADRVLSLWPDAPWDDGNSQADNKICKGIYRGLVVVKDQVVDKPDHYVVSGARNKIKIFPYWQSYCPNYIGQHVSPRDGDQRANWVYRKSKDNINWRPKNMVEAAKCLDEQALMNPPKLLGAGFDANCPVQIVEEAPPVALAGDTNNDGCVNLLDVWSQGAGFPRAAIANINLWC